MMEMSSPSALLEARNVTRILDADVPVTLVKEADVTIEGGKFYSITGPSGSGKSSLLYLLGLLDRPSSGDVIVEGIDTASLSDDEIARIRLEKIGYVFQFHFLLPEFTALENVMLPIQRLGILNDKQARERGEFVLETLGLSEHRHKVPKKMSGGQCQRVAIARALANEPKIILADEPTGNLDTVSSANVQDIFRSLTMDQNRSVIVVTHDMEFADKADVRIKIVDGRIVA